MKESEEVQDNQPENSENSDDGYTRFMDLGAPKDNRNIHVEKLLLQGHPAGQYHVNKDIDFEPIKRVFRINIEPHTPKQYIFWGICSIIIGVSLVSFFTESALFISSKVKSTFFASNATASVEQGSEAYTVKPETLLGTNSTSTNSVATTSASTTIPLIYSILPGSGTSTIREYSFASSTKIKVPNTSALAYLVGDIKTGEIILQKNVQTIYPLASVSKLMTALVANENMDLKKTATVSRDSYNTFGAEGSLVLGEKIKLSDLMFPLLMESSNDGAEVVADQYGRVDFMHLMNKTSLALGMKDTYYEDPSGLDPKNSSTAIDQFKLAKSIFEKFPAIFDETLIKLYQVGNHTWHNRNAMLNIDSFIGGKNGFIDEAKQTSVALFNIPMAKGGNRTVTVIILKSADRTTDTLKLLDFLQKNVVYTPVDLQ